MTNEMITNAQNYPPSPLRQTSTAERRFWVGALGFLALIVLASVMLTLRGSTVSIGVTITPTATAVVSGRTRITLTFPTAMHTESVENRVTVAETNTMASVGGRWSWEANGARSDQVAQFIPNIPLAPGTTYRVTLAPGATALNGRAVSPPPPTTFTVRGALLLFLRADASGKAGIRQIWIADAGGNNVRQITHEPESVQEFSPAPDGTRIAYTTQAGPQTTALWLINADGTGRIRLSPAGDPSSYTAPAWSPVGNIIVYVLRGVVTNGMGGVTLGTSKLWAVTPEGKALGRVYGRGDEVGFAPVWAPDGTHLAFREQVDAQNSSAVVLSDLSPNPVKVSAGPGSRIAWAPDGTRVAYDESTANGTEAGSSHIVIVRADGTAPQVFAVPDTSAPDWSPDARQLVFTLRASHADGTVTTDIAIAAADHTGAIRRLFGGDGLTSTDPVWSPGGEMIVATRFSARTGEDRGLWRVNADGTGAQLLIPGGEHAVWVP